MNTQKKPTHILIVDDEKEIHTLLNALLTKEGYSVADAYNASDALELINQHRPKLILLDIMMPVTSGIELCNQLKSNPATKDILIIILSARDEQSDRIEGLAHGADDYVPKPFHLRSLIRKIDFMLNKQVVDEFEESIGRSSK